VREDRKEPRVDLKRGKYRHFKGNEYEVVGVARHSESLEEYVIYKPLYDSVSEYWIRPLAMFLETVERDGVVRPRFEYVGGE
jgi:cyclomaltodextrinase / maltogenic alpha-amylase / neopullulanase